MKSKAVLFDFDGTLADSMQDHYNAWLKASLDFGIHLKPEDYYPLEGMNVYKIAKKILLANQIIGDEKELVLKKEKYYLAHNKITLYAGVEYLIDQLRFSKIKVGIVTTGLNDRIFSSVPKKFLNQFDVIICGDDIEKGKPSPDPYLQGMKNLNIKPENCIIIENSPIGIESAKSSGAYCIAIRSTLSDEYLNKADLIFNTINDMVKSEVFNSKLNLR